MAPIAATMTTSMALFLLTILVAFPVVSAHPSNATSPSFDICEWKDAMPLLYHEYGTVQCPCLFYLLENGECERKSWISGCSSFCQVRTTFYHGEEQPYVRVPVCRGGLTCTLSESVHQNYAWKAKLNFNVKIQVLTAGITQGYSTKSGITQGYKFSKTLPDGECGYFTFIPIYKGTCGSSTECYGSRCNDDCYTQGNVCVEQLVGYNAHDDIHDWRPIRGIVVFVYVDCLTLAPLPDEKQDPAFSQPGVRLPRDYHPMIRAYENLWKASLQGPLTAQVETPYCGTRMPVNASMCFMGWCFCMYWLAISLTLTAEIRWLVDW
ncbi:hypothetical protein A1O1_06288 [Capronia coronata CBS 617.96]|uniref:Uncharacterized protein n=1 Tax=Capronia coronata CBS 617.96 TaxID=1182541 RepID=W9YUG5_9EURO|nr:uncharacterized protein A1O1_06288 [Capronia coronata CBS 617.96]EXJ85919.1 hypothetical protein A1O1_06288 [Capronia coronata CBS 617.96]